jgi:DNA-binding HxlR family transcriptional regulator
MNGQVLAAKNKSLKPGTKTYLVDEKCPVRNVLDFVGDKWSMLIILQLGIKSPQRFGQLKTEIGGISQKMLTITLRQLERDGFVKRVYFTEVPPRVEYSVTPLGTSLMEALSQLVSWANENIDQILTARKNSIKVV